MAHDAGQALLKAQAIAGAPNPSSRRCRLVTNATKQATIILGAKAVMKNDPHHKVVFMPEVDYVRMWAQINRLEAQYKEMMRKLQAAQDEIDDLQHENAEYQDAEPAVEAMPSFPKAVPSAEMIEDAAYIRPLGAPPAFEAPYGVERSDAEVKADMAVLDEPLVPHKAFIVGGRFHTHLDSCERCRTQPMNLCGIGALLLRKEATGAE